MATTSSRPWGPRRFEPELAQRTSIPGVATGMAYTPVGGEILFIESSRVPGRGNITLTGQIGDVMKESATAAYTLVRSKAEQLGLDPKMAEKSDIHIHVPAGAVPKDGPSAGTAMFTSLASLMLNKPVRADVAMTGEITLRGLVLPIGGLKEKTLAALAGRHQGGDRPQAEREGFARPAGRGEAEPEVPLRRERRRGAADRRRRRPGGSGRRSRRPTAG